MVVLHQPGSRNSYRVHTVCGLWQNSSSKVETKGPTWECLWDLECNEPWHDMMEM